MAALLARLIAAQRAGRPRRSRSAAWPGCSARLARRTSFRVPGGAAARRCRAWSSR